MALSFHAYLSIALLCLMAVHRKARAASVVEVDSEVRSSVEELLKAKSRLRMDDDKPFKMNANQIPSKEKTKKQQHHHRLEMVEETLRMIYHELFEGINVTSGDSVNATEVISKSRAIMNARQSFFSNGLNTVSEYMMSLVENGLEDLPSLPRLEAQECMKRSVCEAHNQPKKYGLIGLVLQLLFPPYSKTEDPSNVASKYQLAARYGRQSNANCGVQYDGCMLNLLDIVQALVNAFIR